MQMNTQPIKKLNNQSTGEEIANSISHGVGALLSIAATVIAVIYAVLKGDAVSVVSAALYGASLIILYTSSTLYHAITNYTAKSVFQVFDHCTIFFLILGTYIPVTLSVIRGALGWTLFGINTGCAVIGIVLNAIDLKKFSKISMVLYILMGWSVIMVVRPVIDKVDTTGLVYLISGGLAYTAGTIFYGMKKTRFMHVVWHFFVLAGSILHFFFVLFYCLPVTR